MKAYPSFDAYEADQSAQNRAVIRELRKLVKRVAPKLRETVKWGNGCWVTDDANVALVYSADDHVQFGFFNGAALKDPKKYLQGSGKYVRHVKVRGPAEIDEEAFAALVRQAARDPAPMGEPPRAKPANKKAAAPPRKKVKKR